MRCEAVGNGDPSGPGHANGRLRPPEKITMKNLAGDPKCDDKIRRELTRARIPIVVGPRSDGEVAATLWGKLGPIAFTRAWYYWVADGPVPIQIARALYADPVGRTDVRVDGHCGCPDPDEGPWATHYDTEGREIAWNPGDKERLAYLGMIERGLFPREGFDKYAWAEDPRVVAVKTTVNVYHIDSEIGLRLFADAVRVLGETYEQVSTPTETRRKP